MCHLPPLLNFDLLNGLEGLGEGASQQGTSR